ncbi:MAG: hypothetical protein IT369_22625 [Candidatus Latescibacteria bacterium]|nr:hypothetical protein [Candidatus Latescibacterota bacterium]
MTTLTQPGNTLSLLWQILRLVGRHFLPLFALLLFPLVNGVLAYASARILQRQSVRVDRGVSGSAALLGPADGGLSTLQDGVPDSGSDPEHPGWLVPTFQHIHGQRPRNVALTLLGDLVVFYNVMLMNSYLQVLVIEDRNLRTAWTRNRQVFGSVG